MRHITVYVEMSGMQHKNIITNLIKIRLPERFRLSIATLLNAILDLYKEYLPQTARR